jgi:signal transduction histidine kinase/CheY-like chemotaxis protein/HPt (histidine-containing phosphotransfer) domain-containing protein
MIDIKDNPNKKYFEIASRQIIMIMITIWIIIQCMPITLILKGKHFTQTGPAMIVGYVIGTICVFIWIFLLLRLKNKRKNKKYIPIYLYSIICALTIILQKIFPEICFSSISIALITVLMYHTIENPDVHLLKRLNEAKLQAEQANEKKTEFLSCMSLEIRTPLNAIVGFAQVLAKEEISGTAKEDVEDILMASNTLLDMVNGILDISKIETNKIEIVNAEYRPRKMINEVISLINARIGSKPIDFKVLIDEDLPDVLYGDNMRIKQIIINLLTNAVKYTQEGRIIFQTRATNEKNECKLEIQVADTGLGMSKEAVENLFNKFQRFDTDKNIHVEGTGLGLAITKELVDLMDGEIKVKSDYGIGTTFTVTLIQNIIHQKLDQGIILEEIKHQAFDASGQKVLVVDDNKINLKVAERLLREYKLTIKLAHSGAECIDMVLDGQKFDLIFMDIMMPKMTGLEVLENLHNIVGFKTPVIALTADVIAGMEEKYISQGFVDCLAKPIIEEELYYILKKHLKESSQTTSVLLNEMSTSKYRIEQLENNNISVKASLELLKDMDIYNITLEEFYGELQNKLKTMEELKNNSKLDDYTILAHALKTEARYVGCNELSDIAYEHEQAGKIGNEEFIETNYIVLKQEADRVCNVIKKYFNK